MNEGVKCAARADVFMVLTNQFVKSSSLSYCETTITKTLVAKIIDILLSSIIFILNAVDTVLIPDSNQIRVLSIS